MLSVTHKMRYVITGRSGEWDIQSVFGTQCATRACTHTYVHPPGRSTAGIYATRRAVSDGGACIIDISSGKCISDRKNYDFLYLA